MIKILTLIFLSAFARAHDCSMLLQNANYRAVVRQVQRLNPEILSSEDPSPAEMYLALKSESERYARVSVPAGLAERLRTSQAKHYAVETLDLNQLTIFYRNALRALEQRAAALWRDIEVNALAAGSLTPETREFAGHLLDTFFTPNGLHDAELSSQEAAQYFREKPWLKFNWPAALAGDMNAFDWNDGNRIRLARMQTKRTGECCLSEPGCTLCPHNRGWRK